MGRRFKRRKKRRFVLYILFVFFIVYVSFSIIYNTLYKNYFKKLTTKEFISEIIELNQGKSSSIDKYLTPDYIFKYTLDINKDISIPTVNEQNESAVIYIYNTHDTEKYSDLYLESYNLVPDVVTLSYILKDYLDEVGLKTLVEENRTSAVLKSNGWPYQRSYEASRSIVEPRIRNNSYQLIIDLHRDAVAKEKTTLLYDGKSYAKFLFIIGGEFDTYQENKNLAERISGSLNNLVPDISRGVNVKTGLGVNGVYNEDIAPNVLLIEVGGQGNVIDELNNSVEVLSRVIYEYVGGNI